MKDTIKLVSNRSSHGMRRAAHRRSRGSEAAKETPVRLLQGLIENAETKIEAKYREIDSLIGEVLLLVDLLFIHHKVTVSPGGDSVNHLLTLQSLIGHQPQ